MFIIVPNEKVQSLGWRGRADGEGASAPFSVLMRNKCQGWIGTSGKTSELVEAFTSAVVKLCVFL